MSWQNPGLELPARCSDLQWFMKELDGGAKDYLGAFFGACESGCMDILKIITTISKETLNLITLNNGLQPASLNGHMHIVEFLLEQGANDYNVGLIYAAHRGHIDIVHLMVEKGARNFPRAIEECLSFLSNNREDHIKIDETLFFLELYKHGKVKL